MVSMHLNLDERGCKEMLMKLRMISIHGVVAALLLGLLFVQLSGCLQKIPHELKSPCVALPLEYTIPGQEHQPAWDTPCVRRPVNPWWQPSRVMS
jgi:hypothetical protein